MSADLGTPSLVLFAPACTCSTHLPSQALSVVLEMSLETLTASQIGAGKHPVAG